MNENINLVEILRDAPKGTKLWSPIFGECEFLRIGCIKGEDYEIPIIETYSVKGYDLKCAITNYADFLEDGKLESCNSEDGECMLFPSKENRDWSTFKAPWKHKHFEPYQKVLVAVDYFKDESYVGKIWCADLYGHYDKLSDTHYLVGLSGMTNEEIIPYKGNEDKLGKLVGQI